MDTLSKYYEERKKNLTESYNKEINNYHTQKVKHEEVLKKAR